MFDILLLTLTGCCVFLLAIRLEHSEEKSSKTENEDEEAGVVDGDTGSAIKIKKMCYQLDTNYQNLPFSYQAKIANKLRKQDENYHLLKEYNLDKSKENFGQNVFRLVFQIKQTLLKHNEDIDVFYPTIMNINKINNNLQKIADEVNTPLYTVDNISVISQYKYDEKLILEYSHLYEILNETMTNRVENILS